MTDDVADKRRLTPGKYICDRCFTRIGILDIKNEKLKKENEEFSNELAKSNDKINQLRINNKTLMEEKEELKKRNKVLEKFTEEDFNLKQEHESLKQKQEGLQEAYRELYLSNEKTGNENQKLIEKINSTLDENEELKKDNQGLKIRIQSDQNIFDRVFKEREEFFDRIERLQNDNESCRSDNYHLQKKNEYLSCQLDEEMRAHEELKQENKKLNDMMAVYDLERGGYAHTNIHEELKRLKQENEELSKAIIKNSVDASSMQIMIDFYKRENKELGEENEHLKAHIRDICFFLENEHVSTVNPSTGYIDGISKIIEGSKLIERAKELIKEKNNE